MFKRRLDAAQTHIALTRLTERGLVAKTDETQEGRARYFSVTTRGRSAAKETMNTMCSVLGVDPVEDPQENTQKGGTNDDAKKSGRSLRPLPARALSKPR